ncbi:hypothetical protein FQN57_003455 [Myotisia sp. PD_48]|nr:hypothetical protein FQN57_003455 [Myotisia sp. PD_48]
MASESDKYDAIIYKRGITPNFRCKPLDWLLEGIEPQEIQIQHYKNRIGNNEGFNILDQQKENTSIIKKGADQLLAMNEEKLKLNKILSEFDKRNSELDKRNSALDKTLLEIWQRNSALDKTILEIRQTNLELGENLSTLTIAHINLRRGVLEDRRISTRRGQKKDRKTAIIRNEIAHGGDILGDIKAIQYLEAQEWGHVAEYKENFQQVYTISFDKASEILRYPSEVIQAFNILASVGELYVWQGTLRAGDRETIERLATDITMVAQTTREDSLHNYFKENRDIQEKFDELNKLYRKDRP